MNATDELIAKRERLLRDPDEDPQRCNLTWERALIDRIHALEADISKQRVWAKDAQDTFQAIWDWLQANHPDAPKGTGPLEAVQLMVKQVTT